MKLLTLTASETSRARFLSAHLRDAPRHPFHVGRPGHATPSCLAGDEGGHTLIQQHIGAHAPARETEQRNGNQQAPVGRFHLFKRAGRRDRLPVLFRLYHVSTQRVLGVYQRFIKRFPHGDNAGQVGKRHAIGAFFAIDHRGISHAVLLLSGRLLKPPRFPGNGAGNARRYRFVSGQGNNSLDAGMPVNVMIGAVASQIPPVLFEPMFNLLGFRFHVHIYTQLTKRFNMFEGRPFTAMISR